MKRNRQTGPSEVPLKLAISSKRNERARIGRRQSTRALAIRALRQNAALANKAELKYADFLVGRNNVDSDGALGSLNVISQGDADTSRDGDQIVMKSVCIMANFIHNGADTMGIGLRFIVYMDKLNTSTQVDDVINTVSADSAPISTYVWDNRFNYEILVDDLVTPDGVYCQIVNRKYEINLNSRKTQFEAGTTTITKGALKYIIISDVDSTEMNFPTIYFRSRLTFIDM
jgi:hypothetical protein